jgi:hypothetical protein
VSLLKDDVDYVAHKLARFTQLLALFKRLENTVATQLDLTHSSDVVRQVSLGHIVTQIQVSLHLVKESRERRLRGLLAIVGIQILIEEAK